MMTFIALTFISYILVTKVGKFLSRTRYNPKGSTTYEAGGTYYQVIMAFLGNLVLAIIIGGIAYWIIVK